MASQDDDARSAEWDELIAATEQIMSMLDPEGEREYDLHSKSFEEIVDFFGMLVTVPVPTYVKPQFDPIELLQFYTELFLKPEILHVKFGENIDRFFSLIGKNFGSYGLPTLMENPAIPLQLRENCIRAVYYLHERLLTLYNIPSMRWCWGYLCHIWVGRQDSAQNTEVYAAQRNYLQSVVFETLSRILSIDSLYCQHTALRALFDLHHPDTRQVIEAYLRSHPDLPLSERKYALATTQDFLYDITEASFDEFVDFLFTHHAYEGIWELDPLNFDPTKSVLLYIQLFNEPAFLFQKFNREQLEKGFWVVQSCNLEIAIGHLISTTDIPLDLRLDFIRAIYPLYKYFFAVDALENSAIMWWDGLISDYKSRRSLAQEDTAIRDTMFETLSQILTLDSPSCQGAALHGLGHLQHPMTESLIHHYLSIHPELDEGIRIYALACVTGNIM